MRPQTVHLIIDATELNKKLGYSSPAAAGLILNECSAKNQRQLANQVHQSEYFYYYFSHERTVYVL